MTEIFKRAAELLTKKDKIIIAIDGQCCAGKSEMARFMAENLDCNVFHLDDFYLTEEERQNKSQQYRYPPQRKFADYPYMVALMILTCIYICNID